MDNESKERAVSVAALLYLFIAVLTFGYAASQSYAADKAIYEECLASGDKHCASPEIAPSKFSASTVGLFGGALWPLYWSWEIFDRATPSPKAQKK